jgi:hypothetical protein
VDEPSSWGRRLTITVPAERVDREKQTVAKHYAGRVHLPGFRKGKVPASVIAKKFGPAIEQDALQQVVQNAYREALEAQSFQPISEGSVGKMDYQPGADLTFEVEFEVRPEIELSRLGGFTLDAPKVAVGDDEIDKVVDRLREERADYTALGESETPKPGDRVTVEITQLHGDHEHAGKPYELVLGRGQAIDMALLDVQVAMLANLSSSYFVSGTAPGRMGNAHMNIVPYHVFRAADAFLIVAVGNDGQFAGFCRVLGVPEWASDPRFSTNPQRVRHRELLVGMIAERLAVRPAAEWLAGLEAAGVPCGPINDLDQVFADPQVLHRGMRVKAPHPAAGEVAMVANPIKFSATPIVHDRAPPLLGEHTEEVLTGMLGLSGEEVAALRKAGAI